MNFKTILNILVIILVFYNSNIYPQSFQNINVRQYEDTVKVRYDILGGREYDVYKIEMEVSSDGGKSFGINPDSPMGDVGYGKSRGINKIIWWEPLMENLELSGKEFVVRLNASILGSSEEIEFVQIKGGSFEMGDLFGEGHTDEKFMHTVFLDDFEMSKFEITNVQYAKFLKEYNSTTIKSGEFKGKEMIFETERGLKFIQEEWQPVAGFEYHPVTGVTWYGAYEFAKFYGLRLPSEAEWEYAARDKGKKNRYGNSRDTADIREINFNAFFSEDSLSISGTTFLEATTGVGAFEPNLSDLFQMSGNVWEWCQDWYQSNYYHHSKEKNPSGPTFGHYKSIRGGSFYNDANGIRATDRSFLHPESWKNDVGFRVVKLIEYSN